MLGVFDSGIGGLTVVKEIKHKHPDLRVIYFGDVARVPYGNKSPEIVRQYSSQVTDFFASKGITHVAIACNTASAHAGEFLRQQYPSVLFYDVITPVVERIRVESAARDEYKVALIGTKGTISSGIYERMIASISPRIRVIGKACPLFVPLVEENWCDHDITFEVARQYLKEIKQEGLDALILGCTHYPLLENVIRSIMGPEVLIISSAKEIADALPAHELCNGSIEDEFYFSDWTDGYRLFAETILDTPIRGEIKVLG